MKKLAFILIAFLIVSCGDNTEVTSADSTEVETTESVVVEDFSNPNIIYGSDFLTFFKSLRKLGDFDKMINFTHSESIDEHGVDNIKTYYEEKFTNMSDVKLMNTDEVGDSIYIMHYTNIEMATKNAISITVKVENDSCKIVLTEPLTKRFP